MIKKYKKQKNFIYKNALASFRANDSLEYKDEMNKSISELEEGYSSEFIIRLRELYSYKE